MQVRLHGIPDIDMQYAVIDSCLVLVNNALVNRTSPSRLDSCSTLCSKLLYLTSSLPSWYSRYSPQQKQLTNTTTSSMIIIVISV